MPAPAIIGVDFAIDGAVLFCDEDGEADGEGGEEERWYIMLVGRRRGGRSERVEVLRWDGEDLLGRRGEEENCDGHYGEDLWRFGFRWW